MNFSEQSLKEILHIIEEEYFLPNEIVHKNNTQTDIYLYWISKGSGKYKIFMYSIYIYMP